MAGSAKHQHVSGLPEQPTAESSEGAQQAPIRQRPESKCPICGLQLHESQIQQHMQEELALMDETWPQDAGGHCGLRSHAKTCSTMSSANAFHHQVGCVRLLCTQACMQHCHELGYVQ